ncbi:MAG: hypothetical protein ABIX12_06510 [Rubrivivax sp.]
MYLIAIAWIYVVGMMAVAEAASPRGTLLGAFVTLLLYGLLPLALLLYVLNTPHRRRGRRAREAAQESPAAPDALRATSSAHPSAPDQRGEPPGDAVATVREPP